MDWFGWRLAKDAAADKAPAFGAHAILENLNKRVPQYLDDVDQGRLIYPACKRGPSDAHGDIGSIPSISNLPNVAVKGWYLGGKSVCCSPKPLRWPRDAPVRIGPGPEYQEKQP